MSNRASAATQKASSTTVMPVNHLVLQRQCTCGQHTHGGQCEDCAKKRMRLQRKPGNYASVDLVPPIVHEVLRSSGQPLDRSTRAFFEPRFGHDFRRVRVHTDERAAQSARAVNAVAYTVGPNIVLDRGEYAPETASGRGLLAHELTHVLQQRGLSPGASLAIGRENDPCEGEADRVGADIVQASHAPATASHDAQNAVRRWTNGAVVQRSKKGAFLRALGGAAVGGAIGAGIGAAAGGLTGAIVGGLIGAALGGVVGYFSKGNRVSVDSSCKNFCGALDVADEAKKTDSKASSGCKDVQFNYQVTGQPGTKKFDKKVDLNPVTVKCDASDANCGGWSSKGVITLGKKACSAGICGPLASSLLHEMVHDWAGWGPPYDKQNVTVPGASHAAPDYLDEWVARYAEKSCFGYNPWGLP